MRARILADLTDAQLDGLLWDWRFWARAEQIAPEGEWSTWAFLAGRGAGKTRSGAEWVREQIKAGCGRIALVAPTAGDARDVMVEGESGLLAVCWEKDKDHRGAEIGRPDYEPSKRRVTWANGAQAALFSAEEPERLRGPQHDASWCDELAAWKRLRETWDMLQFGLRLGDHPRVMVTTTPKPLALLREILADKSTVISRGSTYDNAANLAAPFLAKVKADYEGTRLGRQELYAELLDQSENALWTRDMIEAARQRGRPETFRRVVVAVDPAITKSETSDETGIIAAGIDEAGEGHVLADRSGRYSPQEWAQAAVTLFHEVGADRIVAEGNQGGEMVDHTIRTVWPSAPLRRVHASRGKAARAEPVAALYEQGRVHHHGRLDALEDQLVTWEPLSGMPSPDRLDALVWALTDLMVKKPRPTAVASSY